MRERRQTLGISQAKLAERVSTSTQYIGQIELKNKFPSPEMLERIAEALGMDSPDLFSRTPFQPDAVKQFQKEVLYDLEEAISTIVSKRLKTLEG
jgi:transcriptional regulator with XRE-family HTH domain